MDPGQRETLDVLLVEDNQGDANLIRHELRTGTPSPFATPDLVHVESIDAAISRLDADRFDLVLLDLGLSGSRGIETLDRLQERIRGTDGVEDVPVVILTGLQNDVTALEAIERGAQDYLVKGTLDGDALERAIRHAIGRHRGEQELKRQNERLERFAGVVSHDLRNPLSVASGHLDLLREACDHDSIDAIDGALDRMDAIIEDVLAIARGGQTVEETEPILLSDLVRGCWTNVETADADLDVAVDVVIEADEPRLRQVFENLFRNAVEHGSTSNRTSSGDAIEHAGTDVTVRVGTLDDGFYVEDDGPGIPAVDRDDVFEMGYTTNDEGTGFGLNIVEEIATAHGWRVDVVDGAEGGARFEFTGVTTVEHVDEPV